MTFNEKYKNTILQSLKHDLYIQEVLRYSQISLDSNIYDAGILIRLICFVIDFDIGDPLYDFHSFSHSSEYHVLIIKTRHWNYCYEKLRSISIQSSISHAECTCSVML